MRTAAALMFGALFLPHASPARAEVPVAIQVRGGVGAGWAHHADVNTSGLSGYAAADLAWRYRPGRALVASFEGAGGPLETSTHLDNVEHAAVTLNLEFSRPPESRVESYIRGGLGTGQVTTEGLPPGLSWAPEGPWTPEGWNRPLREWGLALSGEIGLRLVPRAGPVGFMLGLHASHVAAAHSSSSVYAPFLGLTVHPL